MIKLEKIQFEIEKLNNRLLGIDDKLEKVLIKYQDEYEKELFRTNFEEKNGKLIKSTKNYNKAQSINFTKKLGLSKIAKNSVKEYDQISLFQKTFNQNIGLDLNFVYKNAKILSIAKKIDFDALMLTGYNLDNLIKHELVNAIALERPTQEIISNLAASLLGSGQKNGQLARYATTYYRTSIFGLSRTIDKEAYNTIEPQPKKYIYAGVIKDNKIRKFCANHVGKEYTIQEINKFPQQNESFLDPFFAPGGYNCRHRLIPVI